METRSGAYLEIILGSMFSGKTSRLVEIYKQCIFCNIPVVAINNALDTRYDDEFMTTHDKEKIPCIRTHKLMNIWNPNHEPTETSSEIANLSVSSRVILINEGQFFPDLEEAVKSMLSRGKQVYVCGLDGDFERKKFGQILDLIPYCDKVYKLKSLCSLCRDGTRGIFSKRLSGETAQTLVGVDNYMPVCRECYDK